MNHSYIIYILIYIIFHSFLFLSFLFLSYLILSYLILSYLILPYHILSYLILRYRILSYLILSYVGLASYPARVVTGVAISLVLFNTYISLSRSQCSRSCEGGNMTRTLKCMSLNAQGMLVSVSAVQCHHAVKPTTEEECNTDITCPSE